MENNSLDKLLEVERTARELSSNAEREADKRLKTLALRKQEEYDRKVEDYQRGLHARLEEERASAEKRKEEELAGFDRRLAALPSTETAFKAKVRELFEKGEL